MTLEAIGDAVGLTRERVRQICAREGAKAPSKEVAHQIEAETRDQRTRDVARYLESAPGATLAEIADVLGIREQMVGQYIPVELRRLVLWESGNRTRATVRWSDEEILEALRCAATYEFPLSTMKYSNLVEIGEIRGPSVARIYQRFGQWSAACESAGVEHGSTRIDYTSRWTDADITRFLVLYLSDTRYTGAAHRYDEWRIAESVDAPSLGTVRSRFGDWESAKISAFLSMREQRKSDGASA
jgi:hypothetical protein